MKTEGNKNGTLLGWVKNLATNTSLGIVGGGSLGGICRVVTVHSPLSLPPSLSAPFKNIEIVEGAIFGGTYVLLNHVVHSLLLKGTEIYNQRRVKKPENEGKAPEEENDADPAKNANKEGPRRRGAGKKHGAQAQHTLFNAPEVQAPALIGKKHVDVKDEPAKSEKPEVHYSISFVANCVEAAAAYYLTRVSTDFLGSTRPSERYEAAAFIVTAVALPVLARGAAALTVSLVKLCKLDEVPGKAQATYTILNDARKRNSAQKAEKKENEKLKREAADSLKKMKEVDPAMVKSILNSLINSFPRKATEEEKASIVQKSQTMSVGFEGLEKMKALLNRKIKFLELNQEQLNKEIDILNRAAVEAREAIDRIDGLLELKEGKLPEKDDEEREGGFEGYRAAGSAGRGENRSGGTSVVIEGGGRGREVGSDAEVQEL